MSWYHATAHRDDILAGDTVLLPDGTALDLDSDRTQIIQGWQWFDTETEALSALAPNASLTLGQKIERLQAALVAMADARSLEEVRQAAQEATQP